MGQRLNFLFYQLGQPISLETDIPDHDAFPLYAPSFTLDIPPGNMRDENADEYIQHIEDVYRRITHQIQ